jgi:hypothetical protein
VDYALDTRTGEKVFPAGAMRHRRYLCPCCKKEVTVRSVDRFSQRTPHFAHLKGRADKNCENFFESISSQLPAVKKFQQLVPKNLELNFAPKIFDGLSKGLYLVLQGDQVQLYFQFRVKTGRPDWSGQITVEALDGVRFFTSNKIAGKHEIPVSIRFSGESIKRFGNVDEEIWRSLSSDIPAISGDMEFFQAPYSNGRMLGIHEAIVLGEVYIVSSKSSLDAHPLISSMVEASWEMSGIGLFQIRLPNYLPVDYRAVVEELFSRKISPRRPAFKLLDPLPNFIELDGTVRIANNTNLIVFGFDCDPSEVEYAILGGISRLDMVAFNQNYVLVDVANSRGVEIYWQQSLMIRVEKGRIPELFSCGVTIRSNGVAHNLLNTTSISSIPLNADFYIECPLVELEKSISVSKGFDILGGIESGKRFVSESGVRVDAGSFGYVEFLDEVIDASVEQEKSVLLEEIGPVEKWIKSLSLLDGVASPYLNSGINADIKSKALNMARHHMRYIGLGKNSKG